MDTRAPENFQSVNMTTLEPKPATSVYVQSVYIWNKNSISTFLDFSLRSLSHLYLLDLRHTVPSVTSRPFSDFALFYACSPATLLPHLRTHQSVVFTYFLICICSLKMLVVLYADFNLYIKQFSFSNFYSVYSVRCFSICPRHLCVHLICCWDSA